MPYPDMIKLMGAGRADAANIPVPLAFLAEKYPEIQETIARDKTLSESTQENLRKAITEFKGQFK